MKKRIPNCIILIFLLFVKVQAQEQNSADENTMIHTVKGIISADSLGYTLSHEHIMSNYGKEIDSASVYNEAALFKQVISYLKYLNLSGVNSIFDCTTAYFGRRVDLLKKISDSTGIQIITNTGIYGAAKDRYIPQMAYKASAITLSEIWTDEYKNGIDGTDIKPGFIKLAFDSGTPSEIDKKLFEAGLLTHMNTGLTLAVHTGNNPEAIKFQLDLMKKHRVDPSAWIWVHANAMEDDELLLEVAAKGAWVSLDAVKNTSTQDYVNRLQHFKKENLLHKVLLSHDGNGFPKGGEIRKFDAIPQYLIPALLTDGFTKEEVHLLMVENPKRAFGITRHTN